MAININHAVSMGLDHIYVAPRPGESKEAWMRRVGTTTAMKYLPNYVNQWVSGPGGKPTFGGYAAGAGTAGALAGLSNYLRTGEAGEALEAGAMTAGRSMATSYGSKALASALGTQAGNVAPLIGGGLALYSALKGGAPTQEAAMAATNAAVQAGISSAGLGAGATSLASGYAAVPGIALAIGRNIASNRGSLSRVTTTFDPETGKINVNMGKGKGKGNYRKMWASMSPEGKRKVANTMRGEYQKRMGAFEEFTQGMSAEEKDGIRNSLGKDFFVTTMQLDEDEMQAIERGEDLNAFGRSDMYTMSDVDGTLKMAARMAEKGDTLEEYGRQFNQAFDPSEGHQGADDHGWQRGFLEKYKYLDETIPEAMKGTFTAYGVKSGGLKGPGDVYGGSNFSSNNEEDYSYTKRAKAPDATPDAIGGLPEEPEFKREEEKRTSDIA